MDTTITANRLRRIMNEKNLRQVDVVNLCQPYCRKYDVAMTKSHLSQYLSGKFSPRQDKLSILAMALGVTETWLMGYDEADQDLPFKNELHLTRTEEKIIKDFRSLNPEGQKKQHLTYQTLPT